MSERPHSITAEQRQELIRYNKQVIYRPSKRYTALWDALEPVRVDLLDLLTYIQKIEVFRFKGRYTFMLTNDALTARVRVKTTTRVTNHHYAYLCALGLLHRASGLTEINKDFLRAQDGYKRPINQYWIYKYTAEQLEQANERAKRLQAAKVTAGNISHDKLYLNGLQDIAEQVYPYNTDKKANDRATEWDIICGLLDEQIAQDGYTTKARLKADERLSGADLELDKLFKIYNLRERYRYARPTAEHKAQFGLTDNKYIITKLKD